MAKKENKAKKAADELASSTNDARSLAADFLNDLERGGSKTAAILDEIKKQISGINNNLSDTSDLMEDFSKHTDNVSKGQKEFLNIQQSIAGAESSKLSIMKLVSKELRGQLSSSTFLQNSKEFLNALDKNSLIYSRKLRADTSSLTELHADIVSNQERSNVLSKDISDNASKRLNLKLKEQKIDTKLYDNLNRQSEIEAELVNSTGPKRNKLLDELISLQDESDKLTKQSEQTATERVELETKLTDQLREQESITSKLPSLLNKRNELDAANIIQTTDLKSTYELLNKITNDQYSSQQNIATQLSNINKESFNIGTNQLRTYDLSSDINDLLFEEQQLSKALAHIKDEKNGLSEIERKEAENTVLANIQINAAQRKQLEAAQALSEANAKVNEKMLAIRDTMVAPMNKLFGFVPGGISKFLGLDTLKNEITEKVGKSMADAFRNSAGGAGGFFKAGIAGAGSLFGALAPILPLLLAIGAAMLAFTAATFIISKIVSLFLDADKAVTQLAKDLGITKKEAIGVQDAAIKISSELNLMSVTSKEVTAQMVELKKATGINFGLLAQTNKQAKSFLETSTLITDAFGMTAEETMNLASAAGTAGGSVESIVVAADKMGDELVSAGDILKDIAKLSKRALENFAKTPTALAAAAKQARLMGTTLDQVSQNMEQSIDLFGGWESSMYATMLTGIRLDTTMLSYYAHMKDGVNYLKQQKKMLPSLEQYAKMGAVATKYYAQALGMSTDQLAEMMAYKKQLSVIGISEEAMEKKFQKLQEGSLDMASELSRLGSKDAKAAFKQLILERQRQNVSEKLKATMQKLMDTLYKVVGPLLEPFNEMLDNMINSTTASQSFTTTLKKAGEFIADIAKKAFELAKEWIPKIISGVEKYGPAIMSFVGGLIDGIKFVASIVSNIVGGFNFSKAEGSLDNAAASVASIKENASLIGKIIVGWFAGKAILGAVNSFKSMYDSAKQIFSKVSDIGSAMKNIKAPNMSPGGGSKIPDMKTDSGSKIPDMKTDLDPSKQLDTLTQQADKTLTLGQKISDIAKGIGQGIMELGKGIGQGIGELIKGVLTGIGQGFLAFGQAMATPTALFGVPVGLIVLGMAMGLAAAARIAAPAIAALGPMFTGLADVVKAIGPVIEGIGKAIGFIIESIGKSVSTIIGTVADSLVKLGEVNILNIAGLALALPVLAYGLAALTASSIVSGIASFFGANPVDLIEELADIDSKSLLITSKSIETLSAVLKTLNAANITDVGSSLSNLADGLDDLTDDSISPLKELTSMPAQNIEPLSNGIQKLAESLIQFSSIDFMSVKSSSTLISDFSENLSDIDYDDITNLSKSLKLLSHSYVLLNNSIDLITEDDIKKINELSKAMGANIVTGLESVGSKIFSALTSPFTSAYTAVSDWFGKSPSKIGLSISTGISSVEEPIFKSLSAPFDKTNKHLKTTFTKKLNSTLLNSSLSFGKNVVGKKVISNIKLPYNNAALNIGQSLDTVAKRLPKGIRSVQKQIKDGLIFPFVNAVDNEYVKQWLGLAPESEIGEAIFTGIDAAAPPITNTIVRSFSTAADEVRNLNYIDPDRINEDANNAGRQMHRNFRIAYERERQSNPIETPSVEMQPDTSPKVRIPTQQEIDKLSATNIVPINNMPSASDFLPKPNDARKEAGKTGQAIHDGVSSVNFNQTGQAVGNDLAKGIIGAADKNGILAKSPSALGLQIADGINQAMPLIQTEIPTPSPDQVKEAEKSWTASISEALPSPEKVAEIGLEELVKKQFENIFAGGSAAATAGEAAGEAVAASAASTGAEAALSNAMTFGQKITDLGSGIGQGFSQLVIGIGTGIGGMISSLLSGLAVGFTAFGQAMAAPTPLFGLPVGLIVLGMAMGLASAARIAAPAVAALGPMFTGLADIVKAVGPVIEGIGKAIGTIIESIGKAASTIITSITDSIIKLSKIDVLSLYALGGALGALGLGITALTAGSVVSGLASFFDAGPMDLLTELQSINGNNIKEVADGINVLAKSLENFKNTDVDLGIINGIASIGPGIFSALTAPFNKAREVISNWWVGKSPSELSAGIVNGVQSSQKDLQKDLEQPFNAAAANVQDLKFNTGGLTGINSLKKDSAEALMILSNVSGFGAAAKDIVEGLKAFDSMDSPGVFIQEDFKFEEVFEDMADGFGYLKDVIPTIEAFSKLDLSGFMTALGTLADPSVVDADGVQQQATGLLGGLQALDKASSQFKSSFGDFEFEEVAESIGDAFAYLTPVVQTIKSFADLANANLTKASDQLVAGIGSLMSIPDRAKVTEGQITSIKTLFGNINTAFATLNVASFAKIGEAFSALKVDEIIKFSNLGTGALDQAGTKFVQVITNILKMQQNVTKELGNRTTLSTELNTVKNNFIKIGEAFSALKVDEIIKFANLADKKLTKSAVVLEQGIRSVIQKFATLDPAANGITPANINKVATVFESIGKAFGKLQVDNVIKFADLAGKDLKGAAKTLAKGISAIDKEFNKKRQDPNNPSAQIAIPAPDLTNVNTTFTKLNETISKVDFGNVAKFAELAEKDLAAAATSLSSGISAIASMPDQSAKLAAVQPVFTEISKAFASLDMEKITSFAELATKDLHAAALVLMDGISTLTWMGTADLSKIQKAMTDLNAALGALSWEVLDSFAALGTNDKYDRNPLLVAALNLEDGIDSLSKMNIDPSKLDKPKEVLAKVTEVFAGVDFDAIQDFAKLADAKLVQAAENLYNGIITLHSKLSSGIDLSGLEKSLTNLNSAFAKADFSDIERFAELGKAKEGEGLRAAALNLVDGITELSNGMSNITASEKNMKNAETTFEAIGNIFDAAPINELTSFAALGDAKLVQAATQISSASDILSKAGTFSFAIDAATLTNIKTLADALNSMMAIQPSHFSAIATALSELGIAVSSLSSSLENVSQSNIDKIKNLSEITTSQTAASESSGPLSWLTNMLDSDSNTQTTPMAPSSVGAYRVVAPTNANTNTTQVNTSTTTSSDNIASTAELKQMVDLLRQLLAAQNRPIQLNLDGRTISGLHRVMDTSIKYSSNS